MFAQSSRHYFRPLFASLLLLQTACQPSLASPSPLTILPAHCEVPASGQIGLTLNGDVDPGAQVKWKAERGSIVENGRGFSAAYFAPAEAGEDRIVATVAPALSGGSETLSVTCRILPSEGQGGAQLPTALPSSLPTVVISEVMGNPCGGVDYKKYNQYIELYNYGNLPVDVNGWFFFDEGAPGSPDMIVAWASRSLVQLEASLVLNSAVIPPHGFALILAPRYAEGLAPHRMPYLIPAGTIILTVAASETLGDDIFGIISAENGSDTITLYRGSLTVIDQKIDTYGTPLIRGPYPNDENINDDFLDHNPIYLSACHSAERIDPRRPDSESNWVAVDGGTPGDGPYQ